MKLLALFLPIICAAFTPISAKDMTAKEFAHWVEGAKAVQIGRVVRSGKDWIISDRSKLSESQSQEFEKLVANSGFYKNDARTRCVYEPGFAATLEKDGTRMDVFYCFKCFEFQARGKGMETEISPLGIAAPELQKLFEKYYSKTRSEQNTPASDRGGRR